MNSSVASYKIKPQMAETARILGANIRKARKERNIKTKELASLLGLSATYIGLIERGERTPSFEVLLQMCGLLGRSCDEVLSADGLSSVAKSKSPGKTVSDLEIASDMLKAFSEEELGLIVNFLKIFRSYAQKNPAKS